MAVYLSDVVGNLREYDERGLLDFGFATNLLIGVLGDASGDGFVNALDITRVERIIAGLDLQTPGADANLDGSIDALDITKVERLIAGLDYE